MTLYKSRPSQPLKWAVALIIFIMAMCITFSDVYGTPGNDGNNVTVTTDGSTDNSGGSSGDLGTSNDDPSPVAVPEPSTLLLLAGGLSALYVVRRLRKQK